MVEQEPAMEAGMRRMTRLKVGANLELSRERQRGKD